MLVWVLWSFFGLRSVCMVWFVWEKFSGFLFACGGLVECWLWFVCPEADFFLMWGLGLRSRRGWLRCCVWRVGRGFDRFLLM